jgi:hypothetical protein
METQALVKFESPSTCIIAGPSGSGKSTLTHEILRHAAGMFTIPPKKIVYCYGVYQQLYDVIKSTVPSIEFFEGLPSKDDLEAWGSDPVHKILILDDLLQKASHSVDMVELFCQYSHHLNFSVFFIVQNLFAGGQQFRTISLNTHIFILFSNKRNQLQIQTLGRQMFPGQSSYFMSAYGKATADKYGYLLIDLSPHSDSRYKLRTGILPGQSTIVYQPVLHDRK